MVAIQKVAMTKEVPGPSGFEAYCQTMAPPLSLQTCPYGTPRLLSCHGLPNPDRGCGQSISAPLLYSPRSRGEPCHSWVKAPNRSGSALNIGALDQNSEQTEVKKRGLATGLLLEMRTTAFLDPEPGTCRSTGKGLTTGERAFPAIPTLSCQHPCPLLSLFLDP